jgi:putative restriction endonuclease
MRFFWVNIGGSYKESINGNFLWAPNTTKDGKTTPTHWANIGKVEKGDVIFCCYNKEVKFVAQATKDAYDSDRPESRTFKPWNTLGKKVEYTIIHHDTDTPYLALQEKFGISISNQAIPPLFTVKGRLQQMYMHELSAELGEQLIAFLGVSPSLITPTAPFAIANGPTTKTALIDVRVGQNLFRNALINHWDGKCALTGLDNNELLIASHIKPWRACDNNERVNPNNGFLLSAHIDKLFDTGMISFDDNGRVIRSTQVTATTVATLSLNKYTKLRATNLHAETQEFLRWHRENILRQ